jgi:hypothetical protein
LAPARTATVLANLTLPAVTAPRSPAPQRRVAQLQSPSGISPEISGRRTKKHDGACTQRILAEQVVLGGNHVRGHEDEPPMVCAQCLETLVEGHEISDIEGNERPPGGRRRSQDLVVGETDQGCVVNTRHHVVAVRP